MVQSPDSRRAVFKVAADNARHRGVIAPVTETVVVPLPFAVRTPEEETVTMDSSLET